MSEENSKSIKPQWGTPEMVWQSTEVMQRVETARAQERARIDAFANGGRPWSEDEVKKYGIQLNANWLELTRKLIDTNGQINNGFIPSGNFFTAHSQGGHASKKDEYGVRFTKNINRILKRGKSGKRHHFLLRSRNASVSLHGIGPLMWSNSTRLFPRFVPLEDLLIPTETMLDLDTNLTEFAVNLYLTAGELFRMACTGKVDPGWNQEAVRKIMISIRTDKGVPYFPQQLQEWTERPEAIMELWKQNSGYLESDAAPKVRLRAFFYQDPEDGKWYRKIILRDNQPEGLNRSVFIYEGKTAFADDIDHILHIQFGDNSLVPPLKYHSVRGIGNMLYSPSWTLNKLRCQAVQHVFQNLQTWFSLQDPTDRDRAKAILLMDNGILPEGARIIPQNERHQIDSRLLEFSMAQMKQNISENSTSYAPGLDNGTNKERTKFEVQAQLASSSAMVGNVLSMMYAQEIFYYEELVRRALLKTTDDPNAKKFQEQCKKDGIPDELMVPENWDIVAERVLGAGDDVLAQAQADAMLANIMRFGPDEQQMILRMWTAITLKDPDRANLLVPKKVDNSTSGTVAAENVYGTLMRGVKVPMRKGVDHIGYCAALLGMMQSEVQTVLQTDGMGTPEQINGFKTVAGSIVENLDHLAQDDQNKPIVKQLGDILGKIMNEVKGMEQRQQEAAAAAQPQMDPAVMAKIQTDAMAAQQKLESSAAASEQKLQQKQAQFEQKMSQMWEKHQSNMATKGEQTEAALMEQGLRVGTADLNEQGMRTSADLTAKGLETAADIRAKEMQAKAAAKSKPDKSD